MALRWMDGFEQYGAIARMTEGVGGGAENLRACLGVYNNVYVRGNRIRSLPIRHP